MPRDRRSGRRTRRRDEPARTVRAAQPRRASRPEEAGADPAGAKRSARPAIGYQRWDQILFLHWEVSPRALRPLVDPRLDLDLADGRAYVSLTPFTMRGARLRFLPHLPTITDFHELNLRTYVRAGGVPGLWFLSLDAASAPAAALARATLGLPYYRARMERSASADTHSYVSERLPPCERPASFRATWRAGASAPAAPGSLEWFLTERYALYTTVGGRLLRVRVRHPTWPLREARVEHLVETVTRAAGVDVTAPLPRAQFSDGVDVEVLPPERV
jgi:uncharacterized protein YqjF (DUF2071 family)